MLRGYRLLIAAVVGLAFLSTATLAQQLPEPTLKGDPEPNPRQQQGASASKQDPAPKQERASDLLPAIKGVESAVRELIPKEDKNQSQRQEERDIRDLYAQEDMAFWAKAMTGATVASVLLTFAGLALIWRTLHHTKRAADYARDMVDQAILTTRAADETNAIVARNAALELRAYLSVLPAGIHQLIGSQRVMGHVDIRNVGRLPARAVWVQVRMRIDDRDDRQSSKGPGPNPAFTPAGDPKAKDKTFAVDRAIQPQTEMRQGAAEADTIAIGDLLSQTDRHVYVWGVVYYDDGTKRRFTKFRHRYAIASRENRAEWNGQTREERVFIASSQARFHPFGNDAN